MKLLPALWLLCLAGAPLGARLLPPREIDSPLLGHRRTVRIYLPPSYDREPDRRYPVLYVHDGQNVFTSAGPGVAFGWGNWALDATCDRLAAEKRMREILIVAIDNSPARYQEYRGPSARTASGADGDDARYRSYARFLMEELKPKIDAEFRTLAGPEQTGLMGSSLGGICSLAIAWEHPEVFGLAASLSGAFQVERRHFLEQVLRLHPGRAKPVRVYLDSGKVSLRGGDDGRRNTEAVAEALRQIGWRGDHLLHYVDEHLFSDEEMEQAGVPRDKWAEAKTSQHNEFYWRMRAWRALTFLFPPVEDPPLEPGRGD